MLLLLVNIKDCKLAKKLDKFAVWKLNDNLTRSTYLQLIHIYIQSHISNGQLRRNRKSQIEINLDTTPNKSNVVFYADRR